MGPNFNRRMCAASELGANEMTVKVTENVERRAPPSRASRRAGNGAYTAEALEAESPDHLGSTDSMLQESHNTLDPPKKVNTSCASSQLLFASPMFRQFSCLCFC